MTSDSKRTLIPEILYSRSSEIKNYVNCFGKFLFKVIKAPEEKLTWPGTLGGSALHKIMELSIQKHFHSLDYTIFDFGHYYEEQVRALPEDEKLGTPKNFDYSFFISHYQRLSKTLFDFIIRKYFTRKRPIRIFSEHTFENQEIVERFFLSGTADLILEYTDKVFILDFKTTKEPSKFTDKSPTDRKNDIQSQVYTFLCRKELIPDKPIFFMYEIIDVVTGEIFSEPYSQNDWNSLCEIIKEIQTKIYSYNHRMYFNTDPKICQWCSYRGYCSNFLKNDEV